MRIFAIMLIMLPFCTIASAQGYDPFTYQQIQIDQLQRRIEQESQERRDAMERAERQRQEDQLNLQLEMIDRDFERTLRGR